MMKDLVIALALLAASASASDCSGAPCPGLGMCRSQWGWCGTGSTYCNDQSSWTQICGGGDGTAAPTPAFSYCPVPCTYYWGDPHLSRSRVNCDGSVTEMPTEDCNGESTNALYAKGNSWMVFISQDHSAMGASAASSLTQVIVQFNTFTLTFGSADVWPTTTPTDELQVTNYVSDTMGRTLSVMVTPLNPVGSPYSDLVMHVDRYFWNDAGVWKQVLSVSVCSQEMVQQANTGSIVTDGCPEPTPPTTPPPNPSCDQFQEPFKTACNKDTDSVPDEPTKQAIINQTKNDETKKKQYEQEILLK